MTRTKAILPLSMLNKVFGLPTHQMDGLSEALSCLSYPLRQVVTIEDVKHCCQQHNVACPTVSSSSALKPPAQ